MPSLRERAEDILPIALHYLRIFEKRQGRSNLYFSQACSAGIATYGWPGNLRELRNAVERAVILSPSSVLELQDLGLGRSAMSDLNRASFATGTSSSIAHVPMIGQDFSIEEIEREHIARVVAHTSSFEAAAQTLGIDPTTLQRKRKRYGLA